MDLMLLQKKSKERQKVRVKKSDIVSIKKEIPWSVRYRNIISGRWDIVLNRLIKEIDYYSTCIYVLQEEGEGFVKIGSSGLGMFQRLGQLSTGNPRELIPLFTITNVSKEVESIFHKSFFIYHKRGEWFHNSILQDKEFIDMIHSFDFNKSKVIKHPTIVIK